MKSKRMRSSTRESLGKILFGLYFVTSSVRTFLCIGVIIEIFQTSGHIAQFKMEQKSRKTEVERLDDWDWRTKGGTRSNEYVELSLILHNSFSTRSTDNGTSCRRIVEPENPLGGSEGTASMEPVSLYTEAKYELNNSALSELENATLSCHFIHEGIGLFLIDLRSRKQLLVGPNSDRSSVSSNSIERVTSSLTRLRSRASFNVHCLCRRLVIVLCWLRR